MPITNLPKSITEHQLKRFLFGNIEASVDPLLKDKVCVCTTKAITSFLDERKNIAIGDKGSGKTALFRLIEEGKLQFSTRNNGSNVLVPIKSEIDYQAIRTRLMPAIETSISVKGFKHQAFWELYILYNIVDKLRSAGFANEEFNKSTAIFGESVCGASQLSLVDFFKKFDVSIGVKLHATPAGAVPLPDFYIKASHKEVSSQESKLPVNLNVENVKIAVCRLLEQNAANVFIMIDKLDEFVVGEDYETQKDVILGLVGCVQSFASHERIILKIFLRSDLYKGVSFEKHGFSKIDDRTVRIVWSDSDIINLIATRIIWNFMYVLRMNFVEFLVDGNSYAYLTKEIFDNIAFRLVIKIARFFKRKSTPVISEESEISTNDVINRTAITSIFPRQLFHINLNGKKEDIDVIDFFVSHFKTSNGSHNPRLVVRFLNECIDITAKDWLENWMPELGINNNGEFELIKKSSFSTSYGRIQEGAWAEVSETSSLWKEFVLLLKRYKKQSEMSYEYIRSHTGLSDDETLLFVKFLMHAGVLECTTPSEKKIEKTQYELPTVYKKCFAKL